MIYALLPDQTTSNETIAEDGREWLMIEYKFEKKLLYPSLHRIILTIAP